MVTDELDYVVGVDTHLRRARFGDRGPRRPARSSHNAWTERAAAATPRRLKVRSVIPPTAPAYWAIEGTGSYGAGLARYLAGRRRDGARKSAAYRRPSGGCAARTTPSTRCATARAALASETLALPRRGERREALRLLLIARRSAVDVRREALGQLRGRDRHRPRRVCASSCARFPSASCSTRCSRLRRSSSIEHRRARDTPRAYAASRIGSRLRRSKPQSSNARCSATSAHSHRSCSTSPASGRSSPRNCSSPGHTRAASAPKPPSHGSPA